MSLPGFVAESGNQEPCATHVDLYRTKELLAHVKMKAWDKFNLECPSHLATNSLKRYDATAQLPTKHTKQSIGAYKLVILWAIVQSNVKNIFLKNWPLNLKGLIWLHFLCNLSHKMAYLVLSMACLPKTFQNLFPERLQLLVGKPTCLAVACATLANLCKVQTKSLEHSSKFHRCCPNPHHNTLQTDTHLFCIVCTASELYTLTIPASPSRPKE